MSNCSSVHRLNELQKQHSFEFEVKDRPVDWMVWLKVTVANQSWEVLVYDEFHDVDSSRPTLCLFLLLYSLEDYEECEDYLAWCKENGLEPPEFDSYYRELNKIYSEVKGLIGNISPGITSFDYQHRSGDFAILLES